MPKRPAPRGWVRGAFVVSTRIAVVLAVGVAPVASHDLWVLPGKFHLLPGELTRVFLNSGDVFPESLTLTGEHRLTEVAQFGPAGKRDVAAFRVDGKSLSFDLSAGEHSGTVAVGLELKSRRVRLRAADFDDYLSLEGLTAMAALREALGESEEAAVERYTKWAKTILRVGPPEGTGDAEGDDAGTPAPEKTDTGWSEPIGHRLEIVPLVDPNALALGDHLELRVLFEGEALADAPLVAGHAGGATRAVEAVTGTEGTADIALSDTGRWYVRALHMVRRDDDPEVKWESFWCTLTFEVNAASKNP